MESHQKEAEAKRQGHLVWVSSTVPTGPRWQLVSLACSHVQIDTDAHTFSQPPQPGPQMFGLRVGRARVPSLRIQIRGGQGIIKTEVLRLDLYLVDFSGLGSVCLVDRTAGRPINPGKKNKDKPQQKETKR